MTSLNVIYTPKEITLSAEEDGPVLFTITYKQATNRIAAGFRTPWELTSVAAPNATRWFKTREGAEFYALHLHAEA